MSRTTMGSEQPELIDALSASKLLGVGRSEVQHMVRAGHLIPVYDEFLRRRFRVTDVMQLRDLRQACDLSLPQLGLVAIQARAIARDNAAKIRQLYTMFGADYRNLSREESDVRDIYVRARKRAVENRRFEVEEIMEWARVLMSIDEDYLVIINKLMQVHEPWRVFMDLAQAIWETARLSELRFDKEREAAFGFIGVGRRHMRNTAYFYVRNHEHVSIAKQKFPDSIQDYDQHIIDLMCMELPRTRANP